MAGWGGTSVFILIGAAVLVIWATSRSPLARAAFYSHQLPVGCRELGWLAWKVGVMAFVVLTLQLVLLGMGLSYLTDLPLQAGALGGLKLVVSHSRFYPLYHDAVIRRQP